jgi:predicted NACHT family NTPase
MAEQVYDWKRFWCPRSSQINPDNRGYLTDPESEYGKYANPELVGLEVIADIPCLVLLGEPGIGKSQELINLKNHTTKNLDSDNKILELNLRSCTSLKEDLFKDEQFITWEKGTHRLYLFLDSLDEGLLQTQNIATQLVDTFTKDQYRDKLSRLYIRIACRTAVFPNILEEGLKELWKKSNVGIYKLAPLRRIDVQASVKAHSLDSDDFLNEVERKGVVPFAVKPITLKFLLNTFQKYHGQFPPEQKLVDLYLAGCKALCEEQNSSRRASKRTGKLNVEQRLRVAARIAVITIFANRFAVWTETDLGDVPTEDVLLEELCLGNEARDTIEEVLDTGLFSSRGFSRMGWAHQTYAEFLAAWYLTVREVPLSQIKTLIFSCEDPKHRLIPQLHETAAWLASLRSDVLQDIIKTDPNILLQSDVPTDPEIRSSIVDHLLEQYEQETLFGRGNYQKYSKLEHPNLPAQLQPYICDSNKQIHARNLAIDIAGSCQVNELEEKLLILAFDPLESINLRESAVNAIISINNPETRIRLKPLAAEQVPEDKDDRLKGLCLEALWPSLLTVEELFQAICPPKNENFLGTYKIFINHKLATQLNQDNLIVALTWLEQQGVRYFDHPFKKLGDAILLKAWENFDLPEIARKFTKVALVQWREHQKIIINNDQSQNFTSLFSNDDMKRHILIEQAVFLIVLEIPKLRSLSIFLATNIVRSIDILWMLSRLKKSNSIQEQEIWAILVRYKFTDPERTPEEAKAILDAGQLNSILSKELSFWFDTIDLNSAKAVKIWTTYLQEQAWQSPPQQIPTLKPPPEQRVINCLDSFEDGNLEAWWNLNQEMTLFPTSMHYGYILQKLNIKDLPGWKNSDPQTHSRIIKAAELFILNWKSESSELNLHEIDVSAYKALRLLLSENFDFLLNIPVNIWSKFAKIILLVYWHSSDARYIEPHHTLMQMAYSHAPDEAINTLIKLVDKNNIQDSDANILRAFQRCWDNNSLSNLLNKLTDSSLSPKSFGRLIDTLLENKYDKALVVIENLLKSLLCEDSNENPKAVYAAISLMIHTSDAGWALIWPLVQKKHNFGREIFKKVSYMVNWEGNFELKLKASQVADLYIFFAKEFSGNIEEINTENNSELQEAELDYEIDKETSINPWIKNIPSHLQKRGTREACEALRYIIDQLPELKDRLRWRFMEAEALALTRRKNWTPPQPRWLLQLIFDKDKRIVQDGYQLLEVLIESLTRLELELQGETPSARDIWDEREGSLFRPNDENAFSDHVKRSLDRDLKSRGIFVNREVELRRSYGGNPGERTDIRVDATLKQPNSTSYDKITVIIEVKGCWHSEVETAMKSQLVDRYLADNACKYGLYLIGWFDCQQWDSQDPRKNKTPKMTIDEAKTQFDRQAETLSSSGKVVRAYVMNTALR